MSVGISINPAGKKALKDKVKQQAIVKQVTADIPSAPAPKTWADAAKAYAKQYGVTLPSNFENVVKYASYSQPTTNQEKAYIAAVKDRVLDLKNKPADLYKAALYGAGKNYQSNYIFRNDRLRNNLLAADKAMIESLAPVAQKYGVSAADISSQLSSGAQVSIDFYKNMPRESGGIDALIGTVLSAGVGAATGGLSLPAQIAAQATVSLSQGASVQDTIKSIGASLAGGQVVDALKGVSSQIANPSLKAAFEGAAKSATTAALLGQDVTAAALIGAGVAGGTAAAEQVTESAGTGLKAPGQVAAPSAAGQASLRTDVAGTAPEIGTGTGLYASPSALLTKQLAPYSTQTGDVISGGAGTVQPRYTGAADIITPSSLTQYLPEYQAPESTSGSMKRGLSASEKEALSEALGLGLGSLFQKDTGGTQTTYAAGDTQRTTALPVGQYSPGSQALAQALRIGDVGAPIFGTDKDKGKKSGWNVESLRYMGDVGEA